MKHKRDGNVCVRKPTTQRGEGSGWRDTHWPLNHSLTTRRGEGWGWSDTHGQHWPLVCFIYISHPDCSSHQHQHACQYVGTDYVSACHVIQPVLNKNSETNYYACQIWGATASSDHVIDGWLYINAIQCLRFINSSSFDTSISCDIMASLERFSRQAYLCEHCLGILQKKRRTTQLSIYIRHARRTKPSRSQP